MNAKKWISLKKISHSYILDPLADDVKSNTSGSCRTAKRQLTRLAFDETENRLLAVDSKGLIILVELGECMRYCKLGTVQSCTFIAFNPLNKIEILVGSIDGTIKITKISGDAREHCSLIGHKFPVKYISTYKNYALTTSSKEVIMWDLSTFSKVHQLRFFTTNVNVRRASFSSTGIIAVLYRDCTLQVWEFKRLDQDTKINVKPFGLRDVRDYQFTKDGRAMVMAGIPNNVVIINTFKWDLIKRLELPDGLACIKELSFLPQVLDGGANKILAILCSDHTLHFIDLSTSCAVPLSSSNPLVDINHLNISPNGRYIACIDIAGSLRLEIADNLLLSEPKQKAKIFKPNQSRSHDLGHHLRCVRQYIQEELNLKRLIPILKEFGEYPRKHRPLIWASILELPRNLCAYSALTNKTPQQGLMEKILVDYPLADKGKALVLATIINCLVHWCPLLSQSTFLPRLVFPFIVVFQGNHLLAFEIIISVLSNYCQRWFEYHPLPPLNVLAMLENILSEADPLLLNYFCEKGVTSSEYIWPLLQTTLSEVLSGDEWLILWDHLFSSGRSTLLLMSSIAYSICSREVIMSQLHSTQDFTQFYRAQGHVRVVDLLRVVRRLDQNTPYHLHPDRYLRSTMHRLPKTGPYPSFLTDQYPKYLTEDSQLELQRLQRNEEQATILRHSKRCHLKAAEEKRLQVERDNFLQEIEAARVDEQRRCYEAKIFNNKLSLKNFYKQNRNTRKSHDLEESSIETEDQAIEQQLQAKQCQTLQGQVQKLEFEVQTLLETLDSRTTTQVTICK